MVGIALAFSSLRYPPSFVCLTDGEDKSVELMQQNIQLQDNISLLGLNALCIHATTMKWGNTCHDSLKQECLIRFPHIFPQSNKDIIDFDCILAGDVLYKQELPQLFFQSVVQYLAKPRGVLFLCHVPRATVTHEYVLEVAHEYGFHVETLDLENIPLPLACPLEDAQRACIYKMTLSSFT